MSGMAERRRRRREYLLRKGEAYASIVASGGLILFSLALLVFGLVAILRSDIEPVDRLMVGLIGLALSGGCGWGIYWGLCDVRTTRRHARKIPYVPPVVSADVLPPEEVLVRAAREPSVVSGEMLLRSAHSGETPQEELLRAREL